MRQGKTNRKRLGLILGSVSAVVIAVLLVIAFVPGIDVFGVYSPAPRPLQSPQGLVAVFLPPKPLTRFSSDTSSLPRILKNAGYEVNLFYGGEDDVELQIMQIAYQLENPPAAALPKVMVIDPVDGSALGPALEKVKAAGITVVAYDKLITGTPAVDYYVAHDSYRAGVLQGRCIEEKLSLQSASGPFTIELFAGAPDDRNLVRSGVAIIYELYYDAAQAWQGAMSVLQPYIESGKLVVRSKKVDFEAVSVRPGESATVQSRMDALLTEYYGDAKLDAILSPDDNISAAVIASLKKAGYGSQAKPFPVLTGLGCDMQNVYAIMDGEQTMSVFLDAPSLEGRTVAIVDAIMKGRDVPVDGAVAFDNGMKSVPAILVDVKLVDRSNYKQVLIGSHFYYTEEQFQKRDDT